MIPKWHSYFVGLFAATLTDVFTTLALSGELHLVDVAVLPRYDVRLPAAVHVVVRLVISERG